MDKISLIIEQELLKHVVEKSHRGADRRNWDRAAEFVSSRLFRLRRARLARVSGATRRALQHRRDRLTHVQRLGR